MLADVDEWGQVSILNLLTRYARTHFDNPDPDQPSTDKKKKKKKGFYSDEEVILLFRSGCNWCKGIFRIRMTTETTFCTMMGSQWMKIIVCFYVLLSLY